MFSSKNPEVNTERVKEKQDIDIFGVAECFSTVFDYGKSNALNRTHRSYGRPKVSQTLVLR